MDRRYRWLLGGFAVFLVGCGSRPELAYPDWLRETSARPSPEGRYAGYVRAADQVEASAEKYLATVFFTPGKREACLKLIGPALRTLSETANRSELSWGAKATSPLETPDHVAAWGLLGRGLVWKIEHAVRESDHDAAVRCTILATKFGYDLLGGSAMEGSLGLAICNDARRAIAPALPRLSPEHLSRLANGMGNALQKRPPISQTLQHEGVNLLAGVQHVQNIYRDDNWGALVKGFGPDVRAATDRLREMKAKDPVAGIQFFKGLADEVEGEARYYLQLSEVPRARRGSVKKPDHDPGRPWRRFARHCSGTLRPLLDLYDDTLARTRLLVLEAELQKRARSGEPFPRDLRSFGDELSTDPFTGQPFPYRADGTDYRVYSVGSDLSDDGGQTDETFASPDIRLETR